MRGRFEGRERNRLDSANTSRPHPCPIWLRQLDLNESLNMSFGLKAGHPLNVINVFKYIPLSSVKSK